MATYDPFTAIEQFANQAFGRTGSTLDRMPMDLYSNGENYVLTADLPGVTPDDVDIDIDGQLLTIRAQRQLPQVDSARWVVRERASRNFVRQLNLGQGIDTESIAADFENGVLTVTIPVSPKAKARKIAVNGSNRAVGAGSDVEPSAADTSADTSASSDRSEAAVSEANA